MTDIALARSVERFAALTRPLPDAALDRPWAWRTYDEGVRVAFFRTLEELRELAVRILAERDARGPRRTSAQRILTQHHVAWRELQSVTAGVSNADAEHAPAEGEWPLRLVLHHIARAEAGFLSVTSFALDRRRGGQPPAQPGEAAWRAFWGNAWVTPEQLERLPFDALTAWFADMHRRVLGELSTITEEELAAPSLWWEQEEMEIRFRLHRFESHLRQHLIQAEKTLDAAIGPPSEARRLLRVIDAALGEVEGTLLGAPGAAADERRATAALIAACVQDLTNALR